MDSEIGAVSPFRVDRDTLLKGVLLFIYRLCQPEAQLGSTL